MKSHAAQWVGASRYQMIEQIDVPIGCDIVENLERIVCSAVVKVEARVQPTLIGAVDVRTLVKQPVENLP